MVEGRGAAARALALAGRQACGKLDCAMRLRHNHRQMGVGALKDSTMRVRDCTIAYTHYELWEPHDVNMLHESASGSDSTCSWGARCCAARRWFSSRRGAGAGDTHGTQVAATPLLHGAARLDAAAGIAVRVEARHSDLAARTKPLKSFA